MAKAPLLVLALELVAQLPQDDWRGTRGTRRDQGTAKEMQQAH
jgi:hypothetical protein